MKPCTPERPCAERNPWHVLLWGECFVEVASPDARGGDGVVSRSEVAGPPSAVASTIARVQEGMADTETP